MLFFPKLYVRLTTRALGEREVSKEAEDDSSSFPLNNSLHFSKGIAHPFKARAGVN